MAAVIVYAMPENFFKAQSQAATLLCIHTASFNVICFSVPLLHRNEIYWAYLFMSTGCFWWEVLKQQAKSSSALEDADERRQPMQMQRERKRKSIISQTNELQNKWYSIDAISLNDLRYRIDRYAILLVFHLLARSPIHRPPIFWPTTRDVPMFRSWMFKSLMNRQITSYSKL